MGRWEIRGQTDPLEDEDEFMRKTQEMPAKTERTVTRR